jgi:hypothetical protein
MNKYLFWLLIYAVTMVGGGVIIGLLNGIDGVVFGAGASAIVSMVTFFIGKSIGQKRR